MSNELSAVQRLFDECKQDYPYLSKIDRYIKECRNKNEDMNILIQDTGRGWAKLTILHVACRRGHYKIVERLLDIHNNYKYTVNVNTNSDSMYQEKTALHYACERKCILTVRILLQHPNIDVNKVDRTGSPPLYYSCAIDRNTISKPIIMELLKHPDIKVTLKNKDGSIPLHHACQNLIKDTHGIIQMLICHQEHKHRIEQLNVKNYFYPSMLYCACSHDNWDAVLEILKYETDIDINVMDRAGITPLYIVCANKYINRKIVNIIKLFLEKSSLLINKTNRYDGYTSYDMMQNRLKYHEHEHDRQYYIEILQLFEELYMKLRWIKYCYFMKYFMIQKKKRINIKL